MTVIDCKEENISLTCPHCFGVVAKIFGEVTPCRGDFFVCRGCGNVSVLRDRTTYRWGWTLKKPSWDERKTIASHDGLQAIIHSNSEQSARSARDKTL